MIAQDFIQSNIENPGVRAGSSRKRKILVADLLCGAGGSSTGCQRALAGLGLEMELVAVNHWPTAIATHTLNHPAARHYVQDIATVRPHLLVPEGYLDLLMASPTCTHHSVARGGKPTSDQQRSDPWHIITPRVHDIDQPSPTLCATGRVNLVQGTEGYDILFRMLEPHELAAAMGFNDEERRYEFTGTKTEQIKQIGNAVSVAKMKACVGALMADAAPAARDLPLSMPLIAAE